MKKLVSILLMAVIGLSACGPKASPSNSEVKQDDSAQVVSSGEVYEENGLSKDEKVTLKLGVQEAGYGVAHFEYAIKTFEEKFPNVKIELNGSPELGTLVTTLAQSGNNDEMFDIFMGYNPYAPAGMLEPVEELLDRNLYDDPNLKLKDSFYLNASEMIYQENDGHTYRLPKAMYIGGLFFDKKLFEEKDWNQNPKTYQEFLDLCEQIKNDGVTPMTFSGLYYYLGFTVWWHKPFELAEEKGQLETLKDDFVNYRGNKYNNEFMLETYNRLYDMGQKGYFSKGLATLNHTQSQMQVLQRKTAMVSTADWVDNEMKKEGATPEGFEWGYMAIPFVEKAGDTIWINSGESDSLVIWKEKPEVNKAWAKEFILWTYNEEIQSKTAELASALPVRASFYDKEENKEFLTTSQKSIFEYTNNNTIHLETNYTKRPALGPSDSKADKIFVEGIPLIAEGKKEPKDILDEAQRYFELGLEEGKKINN